MKAKWQFNAPELLGVCIGACIFGYFLKPTIQRISDGSMPDASGILAAAFLIMTFLIIVRNRIQN